MMEEGGEVDEVGGGVGGKTEEVGDMLKCLST